MIEHEDEKIRQLFSEERALDERRIPSFKTVLNRAVSPAVRRAYGRSVALAGGLFALFVLFSISFFEKTEPVRSVPPSTSSFYWESPTQAYLSSPGNGILEYLNPGGTGDAGRSQR